MYLARIMYKIKKYDEKKLNAFYRTLKEALREDIYAISPPYLMDRFIISDVPQEGTVYLYIKRKSKNTRYESEKLEITFESIMNLTKLLGKDNYNDSDRFPEKKEKYHVHIITPMAIAPIASHKGSRVILPRGPYPDIISGLMKFFEDLRLEDLADVVVSGLVRLLGYKNLRTVPINDEERGILGTIIVEFLNEAIPLGETLCRLPFVPLGELTSEGLGVTKFQKALGTCRG